MTVKGNQPTLHRQIHDQFTYGHIFPIQTEHSDRGHGRDTTWTLRAREATEAIRTDWPDASWIVEMVTTGTRDGKPMRPHSHYFHEHAEAEWHSLDPRRPAGSGSRHWAHAFPWRCVAP
jgi:hypothetical protein